MLSSMYSEYWGATNDPSGLPVPIITDPSATLFKKKIKLSVACPLLVDIGDKGLNFKGDWLIVLYPLSIV